MPEKTKNMVVKLLYTDLATQSGNIYSGFRPKTLKALSSYSEGLYLSEDDYSSPDELSVILERAKR